MEKAELAEGRRGAALLCACVFVCYAHVHMCECIFLCMYVRMSYVGIYVCILYVYVFLCVSIYQDKYRN